MQAAPAPATSVQQSKLSSCLCTQRRLESPVFQDWAVKMGEPAGLLHRKIWEWCYITQALHERGMLRPGRKGLGFAVGEEPLASLFASFGCEITATDLDFERAADAGWVESNQHAAHLEMLNRRNLCDAEQFKRCVSFRDVDMNDIPTDLAGKYDFVWSSCSLEHLGSLARGEQFIYNALRCLKPGGIAVHTTEYNASSNGRTVDHTGTVIFRRRDMERIADRLTRGGHFIEPFSFDTGDMPIDRFIDMPPYKLDPHLKLLLFKHVCTSVGMIITNDGDSIPQAPRRVTLGTPRDWYRPLRKWIKRQFQQAIGRNQAA